MPAKSFAKSQACAFTVVFLSFFSLATGPVLKLHQEVGDARNKCKNGIYTVDSNVSSSLNEEIVLEGAVSPCDSLQQVHN